MTFFKDKVFDDTLMNKRRLKQLEEDKILSPIEYKEIQCITIPLEEYKELLTYKGKYLGLREKYIEQTFYCDGIPTHVDEVSK